MMRGVRLASITREPDDALCLRASLGGTAELGYYLVFRGDPLEVVTMLREVLDGAEERLPKGDYADRRGKPQG